MRHAFGAKTPGRGQSMHAFFCRYRSDVCSVSLLSHRNYCASSLLHSSACCVTSAAGGYSDSYLSADTLRTKTDETASTFWVDVQYTNADRPAGRLVQRCHNCAVYSLTLVAKTSLVCHCHAMSSTPCSMHRLIPSCAFQHTLCACGATPVAGAADVWSRK